MNTLALVMTKKFSASIEDVFASWTEPEELARWYGPEGFTVDIHTFELRAGGTYRLTMIAPDGKKHVLRGTFKMITKPTHVSFTWQWENGSEGGLPEHETLVEIDLKEVGESVEMTFTHSGFLDTNMQQLHNQGWTSSFVKLDALHDKDLGLSN